MRKLVILVLALIAFPSVAAGDNIIFKSGSAKEGIIEEETPTMVRIRIKKKTIGVARSQIESIEYATPEANDALKMKWEEKESQLKEEQRRRMEQKKKFERTQRARGLKKVDGRWVSPADAKAKRAPRGESEVKEIDEEEDIVELSEFLGNLSEEEREPYLVDRGKIRVTKKKWAMLATDLTTLTAEVKNMRRSTAETILFVIRCFDESGGIVYSSDLAIDGPAQGESVELDTILPIDAELIQKVDVSVAGVSWE